MFVHFLLVELKLNVGLLIHNVYAKTYHHQCIRVIKKEKNNRLKLGVGYVIFTVEAFLVFIEIYEVVIISICM